MESLALGWELGLKELVAWCLEGLAAVAGVLGHLERAARLFGAEEALRAAIGAPLSPTDRATNARAVVAARDQLEEAAFTAAWAEGQAMPLDQAIAEAQSLIREPAAPIRKPALSDDATYLIPDAQWERIVPLLLPAPTKRTGRARMDDRQAMTAIFYALGTGCSWKALPRALGAPSTINDRFRAWRAAGVFERLWQAGMLTEAMARRIGLAQYALDA